MISAPAGGANIISGFGVYTGGINPRAVGVLWQAGDGSLIDDVRFLGGHGSGSNPYNNDHTADSDPAKRWDGQYPSLWVTHGGGGTFADIWTPDTFAQAGFYVSDTKTPGHVYELSNEHHVRNEIIFDHVENWDINAPQTEEEAGESPDSLSLEFDWSQQHHHRQLSRLSRHAFPRAVSRRGSSLPLRKHSFPQRAYQRRKRLSHLRRERVRNFSARQQIPLRKCHSGCYPPSGSPRA